MLISTAFFNKYSLTSMLLFIGKFAVHYGYVAFCGSSKNTYINFNVCIGAKGKHNIAVTIHISEKYRRVIISASCGI